MIQQLEQIYKRQEQLFASYRSVPAGGLEVRHLDVPFVVYKNVFIPCADSLPLLCNLHVRKGDAVLDVGTGSGVIAIISALAGVRRVVAVDWNMDAVANTVANARLLGIGGRIEVRLSNMFSAVRADEKFDVITANLPFMNKAASDVVESSIWDSDLLTNSTFLNNVRHFLTPEGRVYLTQANFGAIREVLWLAKNAGFHIREIGKRVVTENSSIFYAFELKMA